MSKIICDVCGTSYQESAAQCPICGCVRPVDAAVEVDGNEIKHTRRENYTYVKGGRFSKANVQKRNQGLLMDNASTAAREDTETQAKGGKSDKGLVIAVCVLLLAIIAVVIYIVVHFFALGDGTDNNPQNGTVSQTTAATTHFTSLEGIPCEEIVLSQTEVSLNDEGETCSLSATFEPADTTDEMYFVSNDETIATVSQDGVITAVGAGEAVITVTCGEASAQCRVICNISEGGTEETTAPTVPADEYKAPYRLSDSDGDVSIYVGQTFQLKLLDANGKIIPVTWSPTIADICKIEGNSITGVEKGKIELSTTYDGETFTCIVRVR